MKTIRHVLCAVLLVLSLPAARADADSYSGTWTAQQSSAADTVHLRLDYRHADASGDEEWNESRDVPLSTLRGITASDFASGGEHKGFAIVRDAGTMQADGWFARGSASGSWTFAPNANFAEELARRGVGRPSDKQQFQLAMADFKLATLDALLRDGFERPSIGDLVAMGEHGVTDSYINGVKNVPLRPKNVGTLIRMRDHGVDAAYAAQMMSRDRNLTSEGLIRLRDHGVSTAYVEGLSRLGYHPSSDDLVRLADHGVSVAFIERMRSHGYSRLSADDLIRLRDHGF